MNSKMFIIVCGNNVHFMHTKKCEKERKNMREGEERIRKEKKKKAHSGVKK